MPCCYRHDSCAVLACANLGNDVVPCNCVTLKSIFHWIRIWIEKLFVQWAPGSFSQTTFLWAQRTNDVEKLIIAFQQTTDYTLCWLNNEFLHLINTLYTKPWDVIDLIHKSQNASVPYPTMLHSEQKCAYFCSGPLTTYPCLSTLKLFHVSKMGPEPQTRDEERIRSQVRKSLLTNMVFKINYALYFSGNIKWFCHLAMIYSKRVLLNCTRSAVPITIA